MNIYKAPNSEVAGGNGRTPEYVKFYALGIIYAVSITFIVSAVVGLFVIKMFGYDFSNVTDLEAIYSDFRFLVIDLVVTTACLYFSGFIVAKYLVKNYIYHGGILGVIMLLIIILVVKSSEGNDELPFWYNFLSLVIVIPSVALGAYRRKE